MLRRIRSWIGIALIIVIWGIISFRTYVDGTYLLGWDNLAPELNLSLNISRAINTSWQEFQGLGLLGGMGHAADLPRMILLYPLSLIVSVESLRWIWILGMLLVGSLGVYNLGIVLGGGVLAATVGAVFYLLNPAVVQTFSTPFETFVSFYGLLPWMIATLICYLRSGSRRSLGWFLAISIIGASAFVVQTLFVVYLIVVGVMLLEFVVRTHNFRRAWGGVSIILASNLYWFLPVLWFGVTSSWVNVAAKMNLMATREVELMNVAYGRFGDFAALRGWWLQNTDVSVRGEASLLIEVWTQWLSGVWTERLGYMLFGLVMIGLLSGIIKKKTEQKNQLSWSWVLIMFIAMIMLMRRVELFAYLYDLIANSIPLLGQMFRASYTKWSIVTILIFAVGIMQFVKLWKYRWQRYVSSILIVVMCWVIMLPIFENGLINNRMKVNLPDEYVSLNALMKNQSNGRMAKLPINLMWGWNYNEWGYEGSGFLWYGIEQPILDRAFDVWSPYNEGFYNELSTALYGCGSIGEIDPGCVGDVSRVLEKYDVGYVLLDESVIAPGQDESILRILETKEIAEELGWEKVFDENFLTVWKTAYGEHDQFVSAPVSYVLAEGETVKTRRDVIYEDVGTYVEGEGGISYPFANLMRESVWVDYGEQGITVRSDLVGLPTRSDLVVPGFERGERVEMVYRLQIIDNKLQIEWESIYAVNGQAGPKLASQEYEIDGQYLWVQIGNNEAVFLEEGKQVSGSVKLVVGEKIEITTYDGVVDSSQLLVLSSQNEQRCGENDEYRCYAIPLEKQNEDSLLQVVTVYEGGVSPEVCLDLEGEPYECMNTKKVGESPFVQTLGVNGGERYWLDYVLRDDETMLQNPLVRWYPVNLQFTIYNLQNWEEMQKEQRYSLQGPTLKVEVVGVPKSYDFASMGRVEALNCDVLERGEVSKESGKYTADEYGANCDHVVMGRMDTEMSYLMRMQGENRERRSVKIFLHNTGSERNDLEYLLTPTRSDLEGEFDQTFSILSWDYPGSYSLNVETRSFGQYSENKLEPVEVRWMPLEQISRARIQPTRSDLVGISRRSDLEIREVRKTGTWLYRVGVSGEGLLELSQGYDEGWIAWDKGGKHELLSHVKVNGWKNGWILPEGSTEVIRIMYWPQLLEYLGFLMLGVTVVWIARK